MRRTTLFIVVFLAMSLTCTPAFALYAGSNGRTFYSNVPGWTFTSLTSYNWSTATINRVTAHSVNGTLSGTVVIGPTGACYNLAGSAVSPNCSVYSNGSRVYSSTKYETITRSPGGSFSRTWYPNVNTVRNTGYAKTTIYWSQSLNQAPAPWASSANPCVFMTATF
jgi:hypothetical protein